MKKRALIAGVGTVMLVLIFGIYQYFKPHRNIEKEQAVFVGSAEKLYNNATTDPSYFTAELLDKAVEIEGEVSGKETQTFSIKPGIICLLDSTLSIDMIQKGPIKVKGRLVGIEEDDLIGETFLRMDQCRPIN